MSNRNAPMAAGSSAHAAREPDAGIARLQLFAVRSQLPFEQFALSGKRFPGIGYHLHRVPGTAHGSDAADAFHDLGEINMWV